MADATITLKRLARPALRVKIEGISPLIVHRFSQKAKQAMLDKQQGRKVAKESRDPEKEFLASQYIFDDGDHGFPAVAFKSATVAGGRLYSVKMTQIRQALFIAGEGPEQLVRLDIAGEPVMREDTVRIGMGTSDLRYRAMYPEWGATLMVEYAPQLIDAESVLALIDAGGSTNGVGEWRPERDGSFGRYQVVSC